MPKYRTLVDRLISHECRTVKAGEVFTTEFPKAKKRGPDGKTIEVDMDLGENLELVKDEAPEPDKKKGKAADLV